MEMIMHTKSKRYDILLWDIDGTLMDFKKAEAMSLSQCLREIHIEPEQDMIEDYSRINLSYWKRLEKGELTKPEVLLGRFTEFLGKYDIKTDVKEFLQHYEEGLGHFNFIQDDSLKLCQCLKEHGFRQYIVTNGTVDVQRMKLRETGLGRIVDGVFISDELGIPKPQKAFFEICFEEIFGEKEPDQNQRSRVLIIGDSLSSDIQGGINAGIDTCWYCNPGEDNLEAIPVTYEINNLHQILDVIYIS